MAAKSSTSQPKATWQDVEANDWIITKTVRRFFQGADHEDVCQDVRLKVFRSLPSFRGDSKLSTWLYRVAFTMCLMRARQARGPKYGGRVSLEEMQDLGYDLPDGAPDAHRAALAKEQVEILEASPRLRYPLRLLRMQQAGATMEDLAALESVPLGTIKPRIQRGRVYMRRALAGHVTK